MKRYLKSLLRFTSESLRDDLYRRLMVVPKEYLDSEISVEIATSREDLQSAYSLLHDCYVGIGIIDQQPSGMRCNFFSFMPTATVIVAKKQGKVIGTVSAIKDSVAGLPSDQEFREENNRLRYQGKSLVEGSAMAVAPEHRGNHGVSLLLMCFLYNHSRFYFECDFYVAAVHPRAESFYRALLGFQINSQPLKYETLNGAAAVHISMDLSANHLNKVINSYRTKDPMKNIGALFDRPDHRYHYAPKKAGLSINPAFTPTMLKYFCLQQREVWSKFSNEDRHTLIQVYSTYFGDQSMAEFRKLADEPSLEKEFRTPIRLTAVANFFEHISFGEISDLTGQGCFINSFGHLPQPNEQIEIAFRFCDQEYRVRGKVAWLNEAQSLRHRRGMGIQFEQSIPKLALDLQKWVFSVSQPSATQEAKLARRFA